MLKTWPKEILKYFEEAECECTYHGEKYLTLSGTKIHSSMICDPEYFWKYLDHNHFMHSKYKCYHKCDCEVIYISPEEFLEIIPEDIAIEFLFNLDTLI